MPDRSDATQEGTQLPDRDYTRLIAADEANRQILKHLALCPLATEQIGQRLRTLECRYFLLIGLMLGSGTIGGITGATVARIWGS